MGISGVTSTNNMSIMQMSSANLTDAKSKSIQNEITDTQQQIQKLASRQDLSGTEKTNEQKELKKEVSSLNTELKQHQEELLRSQKREIMLADLRESQSTPQKTDPDGKTAAATEESAEKLQPEETSSDQANDRDPAADIPQAGQQKQPWTVITQNSDGTVILKESADQTETPAADTDKAVSDEAVETIKGSAEKETENDDRDMAADAGLSGKDVHAMVSADVSAQQADRVGTIVAKTSDGIAVLKSEIKQDERRGIDTERKQAELEQMEKQEERAMAFQFSVLGGAHNTMKPAVETNVSGSEDRTDSIENNAFISALKATQEEQAKQRFYVSFG